MNILETITAHKRIEVEARKAEHPLSLLERSPHFDRKPLSLRESLFREGSSGIIAEFKRKSPSKGIINAAAGVGEVTCAYVRAGAAGLSVLTDSPFFGGRNSDLSEAREKNACPILRKDFIVDSYQVTEAKSLGADVVLLIAAVLTPAETAALARLARSLGMETILEVHSAREMDHINPDITILGINNRNLGDFSVSLDISLSLIGSVPKGVTTISESGIRTPEDLILLTKAGFNGFLIGEQFMATGDPGTACRKFIESVKNQNKP